MSTPMEEFQMEEFVRNFLMGLPHEKVTTEDLAKVATAIMEATREHCKEWLNVGDKSLDNCGTDPDCLVDIISKARENLKEKT